MGERGLNGSHEETRRASVASPLGVSAVLFCSTRRGHVFAGPSRFPRGRRVLPLAPRRGARFQTCRSGLVVCVSWFESVSLCAMINEVGFSVTLSMSAFSFSVQKKKKKKLYYVFVMKSSDQVLEIARNSPESNDAQVWRKLLWEYEARVRIGHVTMMQSMLKRRFGEHDETA